MLSPAQVEALRLRVKDPHATLVSVLAYTGMRPLEALALTWGDVGNRTIRVERAVDPSGDVKPTKTDHMLTVRLQDPVAADLAALRVASGQPADNALIFPRADGKAWIDTDYRNWRRRVFQRAAGEAGLSIRKSYDLRHSAASLWLHEGVSAVQVARWMGHSLAVLSGAAVASLPAATSAAAPAASPVTATAAKSCSSGWTHAVIRGLTSAFRRGQFCARSAHRQ